MGGHVLRLAEALHARDWASRTKTEADTARHQNAAWRQQRLIQSAAAGAGTHRVPRRVVGRPSLHATCGGARVQLASTHDPDRWHVRESLPARSSMLLRLQLAESRPV